ncbi:hypothetical protein JHK82_027708 [Glycine max]|nr:hypothetical protein JHK87_027610 [Glycine soja]KAG5126873.1 hypothetical protein JHK82_027708 [Glycine max]KAH1137727.1 hypothetical protein GYH30_027636 [Glycine max]
MTGTQNVKNSSLHKPNEYKTNTEPLKILSSASASPKSTLRLPGNKGPKPRVASLSQLKDMTPSVRPWKQPQHETIIAWNKCP